ncbi:MAG: replication factor C large subunit [Thermoplasmatota archaeon]
MTDPPGRSAGSSWIERYRPGSLDQMTGVASTVKALRDWAGGWSEGRIPKKRAVILEGEPGVGKTTAALALAAEMGWEVIELNASDSRNIEAIRKMATRGALSRDITDEEGYAEGTNYRNKLIMLDEADNLYERSVSDEGGTDVSDRGGKKAIVELVKITKQPVLLIVNSLYGLISGSGAPLNFICERIKFRRLGPASIAKRLREICQIEGVQFDQDVIMAVAERSGGDMRSAVGDLQILCTGKSRISVKDLDVLGFRDTKDNIFSTMEKVFYANSLNSSRSALMEVDEDISSLVLWFSENITNAMSHPEDIERGMGALSRADVFLGRVRRRQNYKLWSYAKDHLASIGIARQNPNQSRSRFQFPSYLKKMSSTKDARARMKEISQAIGRMTHASIRTVKEDPLLRFSVLAERDPEFASHLAAYGELEKEHLKILTHSRLSDADLKGILEDAQAIRSSRFVPITIGSDQGGLMDFHEEQERSSDAAGESEPKAEEENTDENEISGKEVKQSSLFEF